MHDFGRIVASWWEYFGAIFGFTEMVLSMSGCGHLREFIERACHRAGLLASLLFLQQHCPATQLQYLVFVLTIYVHAHQQLKRETVVWGHLMWSCNALVGTVMWG